MVAIAARISFRVGDVSLDGAQMRVNCGLAVVLFQTFVTLLVSDGVFFFFFVLPPRWAAAPLGCLICCHVRYVTLVRASP